MIPGSSPWFRGWQSGTSFLAHCRRGGHQCSHPGGTSFGSGLAWRGGWQVVVVVVVSPAAIHEVWSTCWLTRGRIQHFLNGSFHWMLSDLNYAMLLAFLWHPVSAGYFLKIHLLTAKCMFFWRILHPSFPESMVWWTSGDWAEWLLTTRKCSGRKLTKKSSERWWMIGWKYINRSWYLLKPFVSAKGSHILTCSEACLLDIIHISKL